MVGGFSKGVGFVFGAANYVENQAILAAETTTGFVPDSLTDTAAQQTGDFYSGVGAAANAFGTSEGRAQLGEQLSNHMTNLATGKEEALATSLGFLGEAVVPIAGGPAIVSASGKAAITVGSTVAKSKVVVSSAKTVQKSLSAGGKKLSNIANSVTRAGRPTNKSGMVTVTLSASKGTKPDLNPGRWVVKGKASRLNYARTGLMGGDLKVGKWYNPKTWSYTNSASFKNAITAQVPRSSLQTPKGFGPDGYIKALFGQKRVVPKGGLRSADNIANGPKLNKQLSLESANSPFTESGGLTDDAIKNSREIIPSSSINNPAIPKGFSKYSTETFQSPSGNFQTHFYKNPKTGEVFYGRDYKAIFNSKSGG